MAHSNTCQKCQGSFLIEERDLAFYRSMNVPEPTFCPECRLRRRLSWINMRKLYRRTTADSAKEVISMYAPDAPYQIIEDRNWWSDSFDATAMGKPYDFSQSFFQQFRELMARVPLPHLHRDFTRMDHSEYCNAATGVKNCYVCMAIDECEDTYYSFTIEHVKDSIDVSFATESELCYECTNIQTCYNVRYSTDCEHCNDLTLCRDCISCTSCIGCVNLRNATYCIFNQQYSKEEFEQRHAAMRLDTRDGLEEAQQKSKEFFATQPRRFRHDTNNESVSGDYIYRAKNVHNAYAVNNSEDCRYVHFLRASNVGAKNTDSYDWSLFGIGSQRVIDSAWCGLQCNTIRFSIWNYYAHDLQYCLGCHSSNDLFGCVGLRRKNYCILNVPYTKDEYETLVPKIIAHMREVPYVDEQGITYRYGEFFPTELSPFAYNETLAQDYLPYAKDEALEHGFSWKESTNEQISFDVHWRDVPPIDELEDASSKRAIMCRAYDENPIKALEHNCTRVFRLISQEIAFYKNHNIPPPTFCHNSRHHQRMKKRSPITKSWIRACMCTEPQHSPHAGKTCNESFATSYDPALPDMIYCEKCYSALF
ncbi:MAG: hypothetical protein AAB855_03100 [Patescibacteria group bacterium]